MAAGLEQLISISDEVATLIDGSAITQFMVVTTLQPPGQWPSSPSIIRTYFPRYDIADLQVVRCTVVPGSYEESALSRAARTETFGVDIVLQHKPDDDDEGDTLMQTSGEIVELLEYTTLGVSGAVWIGQSSNTIFDLDMLEQQGVLATATRHLFRLPRAMT